MSHSPITLDALQALDAIERRGSFAKDRSAITEQLPHHRHIVTHDTAKFNVMRNEGLTTGKQVLYVQTMEQKIQAQLAGLGVGHLPRKLIQAHLHSGAPVTLATEEPTTENQVRYIAWSKFNRYEPVYPVNFQSAPTHVPTVYK